MSDLPSTLRQAEKLFDQKHLDEAERLARQVVGAEPRNARAWQVLGLVHSERHESDAAVELLRRALALQPDLAPSHNGLGLCHFYADDLERALEHFDRALILDPTHPNAHFNRAVVWLKLGRYREGWVEYEWRWPAGLVKRPELPRPRWDGSPLDGRAVLVHTEQGLGDVLQFARLLPRVKELGGRLVLACQRPLQPLLRSLPWVDEWFPIDQPGPVNFDVCVPLLSLPVALGLTEANLPREVPYVFADPELVRAWGERLAKLPGLKIGLSWQGSLTFRGDHNRSIPLRHFAALAEVPGLSLVSLQKGPGSEQVEAERGRLPLTVFDELDAGGAFLDSAALLQHLDLVITSDTAVAHLAGALGRPAWVVLGTGADWRWQLHRTDTPWYPTMRLFRQKAPGDWAGVFAEVAAELRRVRAGAAALPVGVEFAPGGRPPEVAADRTPTVSVVIPCYNAAGELGDAVESVLAQNFPGTEIVIVDDRSTDDSYELARALAGRHPGVIRAVRQPVNGGPAAARNAGLRLARGRYVCFLDADDEYAPGFFAQVVGALEKDPSWDAVVTGVEVFNCHRQVHPAHVAALVGSLPTNLMARKTALDLIGGFSEDRAFRGKVGGEDIAFRSALAAHFRVGSCAERFLRYRAKRGSHFDYFLDRTRVVDGRLVFTGQSHEEQTGAFAAAQARYLAEVRRRVEAARPVPPAGGTVMSQTVTAKDAPATAPDKPPEELTSVHTSNFPELLRRLNVSLAVSTYQAGRLIFLRPQGQVLNTHFRSFDRPMGMAYQGGRLAVGCGVQVWEFFNVPAVAPKVEPAGSHDACFLPRRTHFTGDIDVHEMAFADDGTLWLVNTRFGCLCNLDLHSSFVPRWRPPFVTRLAPEDRCHLNGLALVDGTPRFATALGTADVAEGWRANKARGGVLLDVPGNRVLIEGLSMPHSPRWYRDRLWLLESGDGSLGWVDLEARQYHKVCELPGFTRGLDFVGPLGFVGLSQVRESAVFSGIPLGERLKDRWCGVYAVNIETGEPVAFVRFTAGVQEVFAVQALPNLLYPELVNEANDWLRHSYVLPEADLAEAAAS